MNEKEYNLINDRNIIPSILVLVCYFGAHLNITILRMIVCNIVDEAFWNKWYDVILLGSLILIMIIVYRRELVYNIVDFYNNAKRYLRTLILILILAKWIEVVLFFIIGLLVGGISQNQQAVNEMMINNNLQFGLCVYLLGPIVEEVIFRGIIYGLIKGKQPDKKRIVVSIIISSVMFGLWHCYSFAPMEIVYNVPVMISGAMFALMYHKSGNILCPMLLHMILNWL